MEEEKEWTGDNHARARTVVLSLFPLTNRTITAVEKKQINPSSVLHTFVCANTRVLVTSPFDSRRESVCVCV